MSAMVFQVVEGEPEDLLTVWCVTCQCELLLFDVERHTRARHGNVQIIVTQRPIRPKADKILEALDHFVALAGWAIGEGYGESDEVEMTKAEEFRKLLEKALGVKSTYGMVS